MTSDKYFSLMRGFAHYLDNSCFKGAKVHVGSETKYNIGDGLNYVVTNETNWSKRLYVTLKNVTSKSVLLLLDDFYFLNKVDCNKIFDLITYFNDTDFDSFIAGPILNEIEVAKVEDNEYLISFNKKDYYSKSRYLVSNGRIFKTQSLMRLLRKNENPWEFENNASLRALLDKNYKILGCLESVSFGFPQTGVIARGKLISSYEERLNKDVEGFSWIPQKSKVTDNTTPLMIRLSRILGRHFKKWSNLFLNKNSD
jgi:hypothetical protein